MGDKNPKNKDKKKKQDAQKHQQKHNVHQLRREEAKGPEATGAPDVPRKAG